MKYNILVVLKNRTDIDYYKFVNAMTSEKRNISSFLNQDYDVKILATAAPTCYAKIIAENEGFDICLGTDFPESGFSETFENIKNVKKDNVLNYLKSRDISEIDTFLTDHIDDFPIIKLAKENVVINPDAVLLNHLKQNSISFEVIK